VSIASLNQRTKSVVKATTAARLGSGGLFGSRQWFFTQEEKT
jgi:hypothetical protein